MTPSNQLILVTVSGPDQPGITSRLMKCLIKNQSRISDMGQAVTHGLLSLSFLLDVSHENEPSVAVLKDLLFESKSMNMQLDFQVLESTSTKLSCGERYILSCVSPERITTHFISDVSELFAFFGINILRIDNTSNEGFKSLDITTTSQKEIDWQQVKKDLIQISYKHQIDTAFMKDNVFRFNKRLIVFDMDSTLIAQEVIDEMAMLHGVGDKVSAITHKAMNGELDFNQSLTQRVSMLKGLSKDQLKNVFENLKLNPGVENFIQTVKKLGFKTAIVSGGFKFFAENLRQKLGMDYAFANELEIENNLLTGKVKGQIVNADQKAFILELLAQQESISLEQVVAIGDGANDLPMLTKAGLGIAFHAKEAVKEKANHQMSFGPMTSILYFLGIPEKFND